jgi:hypothetical protein
MTVGLNTPLWLVVGVLVVLGSSSGLTNQIAVSALSRIKKEEAQEISNASTLLSVLRAAAPMGVATIASFVQARSQHYLPALAAQGLSGNVVQRTSTLFAMHEGFLVTALLALIAVGAFCCTPRGKPQMPIDEHTTG